MTVSRKKSRKMYSHASSCHQQLLRVNQSLLKRRIVGSTPSKKNSPSFRSETKSNVGGVKCSITDFAEDPFHRTIPRVDCKKIKVRFVNASEGAATSGGQGKPPNRPPIKTTYPEDEADQNNDGLRRKTTITADDYIKFIWALSTVFAMFIAFGFVDVVILKLKGADGKMEDLQALISNIGKDISGLSEKIDRRQVNLSEKIDRRQVNLSEKIDRQRADKAWTVGVAVTASIVVASLFDVKT